MKFSRREAVLLFVTVAAALFGVTAIMARPRIDDWRALRRQREQTLYEIDLDRQLISQRDRWAGHLDELSRLLPQFPPDKKMDIHWLSVMDSAANSRGLRITKRQVGEEQQQGDVYELAIECREWEGTLDGMVRFLADLQSEGAMLDVRQLLVKPKPEGGLRGRFTLYCAYTRAPEV